MGPAGGGGSCSGSDGRKSINLYATIWGRFRRVKKGGKGVERFRRKPGTGRLSHQHPSGTGSSTSFHHFTVAAAARC